MKKKQKAAKEPASQSGAKSPEPVSQPKANDRMKGLALLGLVALVAILIYYFFAMPQSGFVPGGSVDAETFKDLFSSAQNVYILMDVRGVSDGVTSNNILQCGVDFAGSSGMGGKNVTPLSVSESEGCIAPDGSHPLGYCFSELKKGITIYIHPGSTSAYYANGLVVGVDANYTAGTCGIRRL